MKKRTLAQLREKKAVYRKHAGRYKSQGLDASPHKVKRMLLYTSMITKATLVAMKRD